MGKVDSFHEYIMGEVFREISGVVSRHMFGGWGIYQNGVFFALIANGELYFKADDVNKKDFEKMGSTPFVYKGHKGREVVMSYWLLPAEVMEDSPQLAIWVEKSVEAAKRSKKDKSITIYT